MVFAPAWRLKEGVWSLKDVEQKVVRASAPNKFPRQFRLRTTRDFQKVYQNPQKFGGRHFTLLVGVNSQGHPRLGIVITKRNVRLAVERNRIRRFIKESFRAKIKELNAFDVVVVVHRDTHMADQNNLKVELEKQWRKLNDYYRKSC